MIDDSISLPDKRDWVEIFPYGLVSSQLESRFVFVFKNKEETRSMPIWVYPGSFGVTSWNGQGQIWLGADSSPLHVTAKILENLKMELSGCLFAEMGQFYQYAYLFFRGSEQLTNLRVRADECLALCLHMRIPFYVTHSILEQARSMDAHWLKEGAETAQGEEALSKPRGLIN